MYSISWDTVFSQDSPVYLTIDIDVLNPSSAPGTGIADTGGITSKGPIDSVHAIASAGINIVGCDLVEVDPAYAPTEQTQIVVAKVTREMLPGR